LDRTRERLEHTQELPADWDTYKARPIACKVTLFTLGMLAETLPASAPAPSVVPTPEGGVFLEWHLRNCDVEIEVTPESRITVAFEGKSDGDEWEEDLTDDWDRLARVLATLAGPG
jgi:hypothetical protein